MLWGLAWWSLQVSYMLAFALSVINAGFLLRLFAIQHDCGHGAFLKSRAASDWLGRVLGVLTLTAYEVWKRTHAIHHSSSGNLGRRGIGDIHTRTVAGYNSLTPKDRWLYQPYRNPVVLFGFGPGYLFFLQNRLPLGLMSGRKFWVSARNSERVGFELIEKSFVADVTKISTPTLLVQNKDDQYLVKGSIEQIYDDLMVEKELLWLSGIGKPRAAGYDYLTRNPAEILSWFDRFM